MQKDVEGYPADLQSRGMAARIRIQTRKPRRRELDLYSWRETRPRSDLTLRSVLDGVGRAADLFLTLIPALGAVLFIVQAAHMAEHTSPRETARIETSAEKGGRR